MLKLLILACLCSALLIDGIKIKSRAFSGPLSEDKFTQSMHSNKHRAARQAPGPGPMPEGEVSMDHGNFPGFPKDQEAEFNHPNMQRRTRQVPPQESGPIPGGMAGGQGNLGMQGLGNIPDPTVWIAKGQEIASQFAKGRR